MSVQFDALEVGAIGRVVNGENGTDWGRDYRISAKLQTSDEPPKEFLTVESVDRLVQTIPGTQDNPYPQVITHEDKPAERSERIPLKWFRPATAAKKLPGN